jgi:NADPH-dependent 2,4-dienoyl-CoA reductase/sulfur reductase-like enzyme/rhodanese-related sulfurtransferase
MAEPLRILIVGGVAAGPKAAARARRLDPDAEITIVEKGQVISYAGCGLPYYVSGMVEDRNALMASPIGVLRDPAFFAKVKRVTVLTGTEAVAINPEGKTLDVRELDSGETSALPYDRLIIATGADPVEPPIPGKDLGNVLRLKQVIDADVLREQMLSKACPRVAIIGGGLIGMEMTEAFTHCGSAVTVVEMLPQLLAMLDPEIAALVEKRMRQLGVHVMTATRVERLVGDEDGNVASVVTDRGELPLQLVLLSIGIRPNTALARAAGLEIGPTGGIVVDDRMETSVPDIFAAGDCTEKRCGAAKRPCFMPLGSVANKEGRVAGASAAGVADRFPGVMSTAALKVFDWNVARTGLTEAEAGSTGQPVVTATVSGPDRPHYYPGAKPVVLKLVADPATRRLLGVQGVGPGEAVKRIDVAVTALTAGMTVDQVANLDLAYAPPYSEAMDILIHGANILRNKLDGLVRGVTAVGLHEALSAGEGLFLLDVRTQDEHDTARIPGSVLVPLGAVRTRAAEIPRDRRVVAYCKTSLRAWEASCMLAGLGYENVEILDGGILAWPYETEEGV